MPLRLPHNALSFKRRLLKWFRSDGRDLPWRRTRDPYRVLVSEFMLQQTQVSRVSEFYPRFLDRFPTIESLAAARPKRVREAWDDSHHFEDRAERARRARAQAEARIAELSLPHLPTIPELRERAEEMFQESPSLDEIVNRAHELLAQAVAAYLCEQALRRT